MIQANNYVIKAGPMGSYGERYYKELQGYKNVPYNREKDFRPLECRSLVRRTVDYYLTPQTTSIYGLGFAGARMEWSGQPKIKWDVSEAVLQNKARARLLAKLSSKTRSEWGTSLAEARASARMVNGRTQQLNRAAGYLQDGTVRGARMCERTLGARRLARSKIERYLRLKQLGGLWLEYWMGWAPLMGDIHNGLETLANFMVGTPSIVRASAKTKGSADSLINSGTVYSGGHVYGRKSVMLRAVVKGFNPNARLRHDLGLVNVAVTIHDIIPWTWMLNWFVNTGEILRQFSDLYGIDLEHGTITRSTLSEQWVNHFLRQKTLGEGLNSRIRYSMDFRREVLTSLPNVKLAFDFSGLSVTRAATVFSLLTQRLHKWAN